MTTKLSFFKITIQLIKKSTNFVKSSWAILSLFIATLLLCRRKPESINRLSLVALQTLMELCSAHWHTGCNLVSNTRFIFYFYFFKGTLLVLGSILCYLQSCLNSSWDRFNNVPWELVHVYMIASHSYWMHIHDALLDCDRLTAEAVWIQSTRCHLQETSLRRFELCVMLEAAIRTWILCVLCGKMDPCFHVSNSDPTFQTLQQKLRPLSCDPQNFCTLNIFFFLTILLKIPAYQHFLKYSENWISVWYQKLCHLQTHLSHLSALIPKLGLNFNKSFGASLHS